MDVEDLAPLIDTLQCGAMLLARDGRITHVNQRLCEMMQRMPRELIGQSMLEIYPDGPGREAIQFTLEHFDQSREQEFFLPRPDGTQLPVIVAGRRVKGSTAARDHRIVTVIDITRQKQTELELQERFNDIASISDTVVEQALTLKRHSERLEARVRERTRALHEANMEAIYMLAEASEAKDHDTGAHVRRIRHYTRLLADELGLPESESDRIAYSSILHDVGKIHVPDDILHKPMALSADEWKIMREHTIAGERILSRTAFFDVARTIARSHHENWDGSGYPDGLQAGEIPLPARIVRVADVYDALTTARVYKPAWNRDRAAAFIEGQRVFDPDVLQAFLRVYRAGRLHPEDAELAPCRDDDEPARLSPARAPSQSQGWPNSASTTPRSLRSTSPSASTSPGHALEQP